MSLIPENQLNAINRTVLTRGYVDRADILSFLQAIPTNDAPVIIREVQDWLKFLHDDPQYAQVRFAPGEIDAIISDLDSYGRVQPEHLLQYKATGAKAPPQTR